ncbi:MAG: hypothetical protein OSB41_06265 [Kiritimatiellae bacterium]|nr:hypothetical protein [Kiritimatiellia bacterium]
MNANSELDHSRAFACIGGSLTLVLLAFCILLPLDLHAATAKKKLKRNAIVAMSDGTQLDGIVQLARGKDFVLTPVGDKSDTVNSVTLRNTRHQVRTFNLNIVKEMTFSNLSEKYAQKFKIDGASNVLDFKKVRFGKDYPIIRQKCTVTFNSGEIVTGVLFTRALYVTEVDLKTGFHGDTTKVIVASKYTGKPGMSYDDVVRIEHIQFLDEGEQFARSMPIDFRSFDFDSIPTNKVKITVWGDTDFLSDGVYTRQEFEKVNKRVLSEGGKPGECVPYRVGMRGLTMDTLSKVEVKRANDGTIRVHSTLGENVFLAAEVNGMWVAGWPAEGTLRTKLFKSVEKQFLKVQDYYTEKKLLGIISKKNGKDITALVSLRRAIPDPAAALEWAIATAWGAGANFEMAADGKLAEFYRLSIWRFTRDPKTERMALVDRGTFDRVRLDIEDKTPEMGVLPSLWPVVMKDNTLIVGGSDQSSVSSHQ